MTIVCLQCGGGKCGSIVQVSCLNYISIHSCTSDALKLHLCHLIRCKTAWSRYQYLCLFPLGQPYSGAAVTIAKFDCSDNGMHCSCQLISRSTSRLSTVSIHVYNYDNIWKFHWNNNSLRIRFVIPLHQKTITIMVHVLKSFKICVQHMQYRCAGLPPTVPCIAFNSDSFYLS